MTTLTAETRDQVAEILQHPFGNRVADPYLADAVTRGHLGLRRPEEKPAGISVAVAAPHGSILEGLSEGRKLRRKQGLEVGRGTKASPRKHRTWYLRRSWQLDQGNTPECVAYTKKHCELALPIGYKVNRTTPDQDYARMKELDGYPNEDGTWFEFAVAVGYEQGIIERHWQYSGDDDDEAVIQWLLDIGPMALGAFWTEDMFRTTPEGLITLGPRDDPNGERIDSDAFKYGHETALIGVDVTGDEPLVKLLNSWGNENFGIDGRGDLPWSSFKRLMREGGDLFGVVERRKAA